MMRGEATPNDIGFAVDLLTRGLMISLEYLPSLLSTLNKEQYRAERPSHRRIGRRRPEEMRWRRSALVMRDRGGREEGAGFDKARVRTALADHSIFAARRLTGHLRTSRILRTSTGEVSIGLRGVRLASRTGDGAKPSNEEA